MLAILAILAYPTWRAALLGTAGSIPLASDPTAVTSALLACSLGFGCIMTEAFVWMSLGVSRRDMSFIQKEPSSLLSDSLAREVLVYFDVDRLEHLGGWFGRIRMLGGMSVATSVAALLYAWVGALLWADFGYQVSVSRMLVAALALGLIGVLTLLLSLERSKRIRAWIDAACYIHHTRSGASPLSPEARIDT